MELSTLILIGLISVVALMAIIWRFASRRYSLPCPVWLRWLVELDNPFTRTNRAAVIIEHLELQTGMTVLDAGCGPGRLTIPIAQKVGDEGTVIALDIQPGMLNRVKNRARNANITNIQFVEAGIGQGKLTGNLFDRALLVTVLGEIPDQEAALKEIHEALKPGGILSVTEIMFDPHFQSRKTVMKIAKSIGFNEYNYFGNRIAFTLNLEKSSSG